MRGFAKRILHGVFGEYACYRIFGFDLIDFSSDVSLDAPLCFADVTRDDVERASEETMREQAWYGGDGSLGFGIYRGEQLVCVQWYWYGERYAARNYWPLGLGEAKSVQLFTIPVEEGKGLATKLKEHSARRMKEAGFVRLYSRVWCTHRASGRVNEKAGWRHVTTVVDVQLLGRWPMRFGGREWLRRVRGKSGAKSTGVRQR